MVVIFDVFVMDGVFNEVMGVFDWKLVGVIGWLE